MNLVSLNSTIEDLFQEVFKPLITEIKFDNIRCTTELNARSPLNFSKPKWDKYNQDKIKSVDAKLNELEEQSHPLIKFRESSLNEEFETLCNRATSNDWEVINQILAEQILNKTIIYNKYYKKISQSKYFKPANTYTFEISCTYCGHNWIYPYSGLTLPHIAEKSCPKCQTTAKITPFQSRAQFSFQTIKDLFELFYYELKKINALSEDIPIIDEVLHYDEYSKNKYNIPNELRLIIEKLQGIYHKYGRQIITEQEFFLTYDEALFDKAVNLLIQYGVVKIEKVIDCNKTAKKLASNGFIFCASEVESYAFDFEAVVLGQPKNIKKLTPIVVKKIDYFNGGATFIYKKLYILNKNYMLADTTELEPKQIKYTKNKNEKYTSKRVFVITTSKNSDGFIDFIEHLHIEQTTQKLFLGAKSQLDNGVSQLLNSKLFSATDIIVIVRGGGDLKHNTFNVFHSMDTKKCIENLINQGVTIVTGVGHSTNNFPFNDVVKYSESTPTKAAHRVNLLVNDK